MKVDSMSDSESAEDANVRKVKSSLEGVNSHDLNRSVECDSESIINYVPTSPRGIAGKAPEIEEMAELFQAFPDVQFVTDQIMSGGDWVAVKGLLTGTNTGPVRVGRRENKPTNKRFISRRAVFHKFKDGKIVETHGYFDPREIPVQLGWVSDRVNRNLITIVAGLGIMTYEALLMTVLVYAGGRVPGPTLVLLLAPFFAGMLSLMSGIRTLRRILLWHP
jgi:predicted ester cyclase